MTVTFDTKEQIWIFSDARRLIKSGVTEIVLGFLRERTFNKLDSISLAWQDTFSNDEEVHSSSLTVVHESHSPLFVFLRTAHLRKGRYYLKWFPTYRSF
jgi:hypothetical protein